jgi:hypothetical protein
VKQPTMWLYKKLKAVPSPMQCKHPVSEFAIRWRAEGQDYREGACHVGENRMKCCPRVLQANVNDEVERKASL